MNGSVTREYLTAKLMDLAIADARRPRAFPTAIDLGPALNSAFNITPKSPRTKMNEKVAKNTVLWKYYDDWQKEYVKLLAAWGGAQSNLPAGSLAAKADELGTRGWKGLLYTNRSYVPDPSDSETERRQDDPLPTDPRYLQLIDGELAKRTSVWGAYRRRAASRGSID